MTLLAAELSKLEKLEEEFITKFDAILVEEGMKVFVLWANAFPTRDLRFVSGMGTATWASTRIDESIFLIDIDDVVVSNCNKSFWSDRYADMLEPLTHFNTLFWSNGLHKYPSLHDIIYNPVTKTVECGNIIIQLY